jgi:hypothetical protein
MSGTKIVGRLRSENISHPLVDAGPIRERFLEEQEKYGDGYMAEICYRLGWVCSRNSEKLDYADTTRLLRRLGIIEETKHHLFTTRLHEGVAKQIVEAMGLDPVDCGF